MLVGWIVNEQTEVTVCFRDSSKSLERCGIQSEFCERTSALISRCALQIRLLVNYASLLQEMPSLIHKHRVTNVIRRFDVVPQRTMKLLNGLADCQRHVMSLA